MPSIENRPQIHASTTNRSSSIASSATAINSQPDQVSRLNSTASTLREPAESRHISAAPTLVEQVLQAIFDKQDLDNTEDINDFEPKLTLLQSAAFSNNAEAIDLLIQYGADINKASTKGATPIAVAAQLNNTKAIELLMQFGADINKPANNGATPAFIAARQNSKEALKLLIEAGADINKPLTSGATPVYIAAQQNSKEALQLLIKAGADINKPLMSGATPVRIAAQRNSKEALQLLIQASADIYKTDNNGQTPTFVAAYMDSKEALQQLIKNGTDINKADNDGFTPVFSAAANRSGKDTLQLLIKNGADIHKAGNDGCTPVYMAAAKNNKDTLELLIKNGADLNKANNDGCTPLFIAAAENNKDTLELLIKNGADLNKANNDGCTPVFIAAAKNHTKALQLLIEAGADTNKTTDNGITPLVNAAAQENNLQAVQLLIQAGADIHKASNKVFTPGYVAALENNKEVIHLLIQAGAGDDINKIDAFTAINNNNLKAINSLLYCGLNINMKRNNQSLLTYAIQNKRFDISKMINYWIQNGHASFISDSIRNGDIDSVKIAIDSGHYLHGKNELGLTHLQQAAFLGNEQIIKLLIDAQVNINEADTNNKTALFIAAENGHENAVIALERAKANAHIKHNSLLPSQAVEKSNFGLIRKLQAYELSTKPATLFERAASSSSFESDASSSTKMGKNFKLPFNIGRKKEEQHLRFMQKNDSIDVDITQLPDRSNSLRSITSLLARKASNLTTGTPAMEIKRTPTQLNKSTIEEEPEETALEPTRDTATPTQTPRQFKKTPSKEDGNTSAVETSAVTTTPTRRPRRLQMGSDGHIQAASQSVQASEEKALDTKQESQTMTTPAPTRRPRRLELGSEGHIQAASTTLEPLQAQPEPRIG